MIGRFAQQIDIMDKNPFSRRRGDKENKAPSKSLGEIPKTPFASVGPPNFSYGSATTALPRQISLADTKLGIYAAMNKAAKDAHERDVRAGKAVPQPEGLHPLARFYEEELDEIPNATPITPPKIRPLRDEPLRLRRSTRNPGRAKSEESEDPFKRSPTPSDSEGRIRRYVSNHRIGVTSWCYGKLQGF